MTSTTSLFLRFTVSYYVNPRIWKVFFWKMRGPETFFPSNNNSKEPHSSNPLSPTLWCPKMVKSAWVTPARSQNLGKKNLQIPFTIFSRWSRMVGPLTTSMAFLRSSLNHCNRKYLLPKKCHWIVGDLENLLESRNALHCEPCSDMCSSLRDIYPKY